MPSTTPVYGLPYPNGSDSLGNIQDDMQGLAESIESTLTGFGGIAAPGAWTTIGGSGAPAFVSGWGAFGFPHQVPQFRKVGNEVKLRGLVLRSGAGTSGAFGIFTLPVGCRPLAELVFATLGNNNALMRVDVEANGVVSSQLNVATSGYVSLSGIRFDID